MLVKKKLDVDNNLNFQWVNDYLDEIKELYQTIYQDFLKSCIFPIEIIETMKTINNKHKCNDEENIKKEYEFLSKQIFVFSEKIKKSSYENDVFAKIKKDNDGIINYIQQ